MFRLAERLGMTVARLGVEMDSDEFTHWHAIDGIDADRRAQETRDRADGERHAASAREAARRKAEDAALGDKT